MQISRDSAKALLRAAGAATTKSGKPLSNDALAKKLDDSFTELAELEVEEVKGLDDDTDLDTLLNTLEDEKEVKVVGDEPSPPSKRKVKKKVVKSKSNDEEPKTDKEEKKKTTRKTVSKASTNGEPSDKKKAAKKKVPKKKDRYGSREGSIAFEINKSLSKTTKDVATIYAELEENGVETTNQRIRDHLRRMHGDELIGKKDTKYHTLDKA